MRHHAGDTLHARILGHQAVTNEKRSLAVDRQRRTQQQIQGAIDGTLRRIFHGNDADVGGTGLDRSKHFIKRGTRDPLDGMPEMIECRLLGKRTGRAQEGNFEGLLQAAAG